MRPKRVLDLFSGAGGAGMGYANAGFIVTGVDLRAQPRYPFRFIQANAMDVLSESPLMLRKYDLIHASPPCQRYTRNARQQGTAHLHPDLIDPVRDALEHIGLPYIIENVELAPLRDPIKLCGTMFGLGVFRHRSFEISGFDVAQPAHRRHRGRVGDGRYVTVAGHTGYNSTRDGRIGALVEDWRRAMCIDWMTAAELAEAIPPTYTHYIGAQLMRLYREAPTYGSA